jgi:hypothetical protein
MSNEDVRINIESGERPDSGKYWNLRESDPDRESQTVDGGGEVTVNFDLEESRELTEGQKRQILGAIFGPPPLTEDSSENDGKDENGLKPSEEFFTDQEVLFMVSLAFALGLFAMYMMASAGWL